jgi:polyisoprenoid-binding protein YceI
MAKRLARPTTKRGLALTLLTGLLVVVVVAFALVYFVLFPTSSPKPFKLGSSTSPTTSTSAAGPSSTASGSSAANGKLGGNWKIASGSQAGYRVREKLAFLPAQSDAVGRTSSITGSATFAQAKGNITIESASFDVAVNTLKSDKSQRDEKIHSIGLESDRYPTATFSLAAPVKLPASVLTGSVVHVPITGVFEIHGTSKRETVPLELKLAGSTVEAVGSLTFPWSEFNMTAPSVGGFVNVTEKATMEFELDLQRA